MPTRSRRTSTACSPPGQVDAATALADEAVAAARELGNPYWIAYTLWIVGLAFSKVDPQRALAVWDEGTAVVAEHGVRFFEGFMSRDAALLHTSHGQLERALSLFDTSIEAFLRSGAVAQLVITLASLPALLERLDQPGAARTLLAAMANHPASFHHVPTLTELSRRLDARLGSEAADEIRRHGRRLRPPGRRGVRRASHRRGAQGPRHGSPATGSRA